MSFAETTSTIVYELTLDDYPEIRGVYSIYVEILDVPYFDLIGHGNTTFTFDLEKLADDAKEIVEYLG